MPCICRRWAAVFVVAGCCYAWPVGAIAQDRSAPADAVTVSGSLRTRVESWDWFGTAPDGTYTFNGSILRAGLTQTRKHVAWQLELAVPFLLGLPDDAMQPSPLGALGLGANYLVANERKTSAATVFVKQASLSISSIGGVAGQSLRVGRMEFSDGAEVTPKDATLAALKRDRIAQRLIGSFTFTHVGRSFDGVRYALDRGASNVTALVARPTRGVFDVDGWSELKVNLFYAAVTRQTGGRDKAGEWRVFGVGYQDYRQPDHIAVATIGGHALRALTTGSGTFDLLVWGAGQTGTWRTAAHRAGALALEGGWQPRGLRRLKPWLRGGYNAGSGDRDAHDDRHATFFQVLPTPRIYARFPFFNMMNTVDVFASAIVRPSPRVTLRSDLHSLRLTTAQDGWYQGGGAFQNGNFGYATRPSNGRVGLATLVDVSADWTINPRVVLSGYYGHARGRSVPAAIYSAGRSARFGYVEGVLRF